MSRWRHSCRKRSRQKGRLAIERKLDFPVNLDSTFQFFIWPIQLQWVAHHSTLFTGLRDITAKLKPPELLSAGPLIYCIDLSSYTRQFFYLCFIVSKSNRFWLVLKFIRLFCLSKMLAKIIIFLFFCAICCSFIINYL